MARPCAFTWPNHVHAHVKARLWLTSLTLSLSTMRLKVFCLMLRTSPADETSFAIAANSALGGVEGCAMACSRALAKACSLGILPMLDTWLWRVFVCLLKMESASGLDFFVKAPALQSETEHVHMVNMLPSAPVGSRLVYFCTYV